MSWVRYQEEVESLIAYPPQTWCKAFIGSKCKFNIVDNNISESFNLWIIDEKGKPIIDTSKGIRLKCMNMKESRG